jgi:hypothetical protein
VVNNLPDNAVGAIVFGPASVPVTIANAIMRPTLVIYHTGDAAGVIQAANALFTNLTGTQVKERVGLSGGSNAGPCGFHLFNGLDSAFISSTAGFIERYNGTFGGAPVAVAVEYRNGSLDHYFITHSTDEMAILDAGVTIRGWTRTGQSFNVYPTAQAGTSPVCRFYIPPELGDSHFYGRGTQECNATAASNPSFVNEDAQFFHVMLPAQGVCPAGTRPVYRVFSNRPDANHRYTVSRAIRDQMTAMGWLAEGDGDDMVVMCSPL